MLSSASSSLAMVFMHGFHAGGGRGDSEFGLLIVGLCFAGLLVWAIQRSGRTTS